MSKELSSQGSDPAQTVASAPTLRELSPIYDETHHRLYVEILHEALGRREAGAPRNIALTGHYGSGKSSVIQGLLTRIASEKQAISISLSSLGISDADDRDSDATLNRSVTNRIQKEIVKQLLYREPPSKMRASRYRRIQPFSWVPALVWSTIASAMVIAIVKLAGRPQRLAVNWTLLGAAAALTGAALLLAQWRFRGRVWLEKLSAGPASVTLTGSSNSYFDDYLDEIVYFFAVSKCRVVIFEDLDRFNDAHIFETLRGLNTILNNAKQLGAPDDPIRFVYAVRDSIFELLDAESAVDTEPTVDASISGRRRFAANQIEAPSTSRTKFFDLVVPMVPFITYRTSRDLIAKEMEDSPDRPSAEVIKLVASHITDMRLVRNIRNEFEVFRARVLPPHGLTGLSADRLFAMMVYKNLHLSDFEKIKTGDSKLDVVYDAYRELVNEEIDTRQRRIRETRGRLRSAALTPERCEERGERLAEFVKLVFQTIGYGHYGPQQMQLRANGNVYTLNRATEALFWRDVLGGSAHVDLLLPTGVQSLGQAELETILGTELHPTDWEDNIRASLCDNIAAVQAEVEELRRADLACILDRSSLTVTVGQEPLPLRELADRVLGSVLAVDLLAAGHIDQNFSLYVAQYYGVHLGPSAMNFILHVVQHDTQDIHYRFDSPADIKALVEELGPDFLGEESAYNVEIFDYLLAAPESDLLKPTVTNLARGGDSDRHFLDAYMTSGRHRDSLIRRLSPAWDEIFIYVVDAGKANPTDAAKWISAALAGASPDRSYASSEAARQAIETLSDAIAALTVPGTDGGTAPAVAAVLARLGVAIHDLTRLDPRLREEVVARNAYRVNRANLTAALGSPDASLSLDALATADAQIHDHVVHHLKDYIAILDEDRSQISIENPDNFVSVLNALSDASPHDLAAVIDRAASGCKVVDLQDVPESQWPTVVAAQRCRASMSNVTAYLGAYDDFDEELGQLLVTVGAVEDAGEAPESDRNAMALRILNTEHIPLERLEPLLASLNSPVSAQSISRSIGSVVPELVAAGVLSDDQFAFERIDHADWATKERLINTSATFVEYLPQLNLTNEDLMHLFRSARIPREVRSVVLKGAVSLEHLSGTGADVVATRANTEGLAVAPTSLVALAEAGTQPTLLLQLLLRQVDELPIEDMFAVLGAMQEPYRSVPQFSGNSPAVVPLGERALFDRLARDGHLHLLRKVRGKNLVEVVRRSQ